MIGKLELKDYSSTDYIFKSVLRYKDSETLEDIELVNSLNKVGFVSEKDFMFASCVVEFGLLLRNSIYLGDASYENLMSRLSSIKLNGDYYKEEFKELVAIMSDR